MIQVKLIFKDSPFFTAKRKQRITEQMSFFRDYLVKIGFNPPLELPPLGTAPISSNMITGGFVGEGIYYGDFYIREDKLDDAMIIRAVYADYSFPKILDTLNQSRWDYPYRESASLVFGRYFNWSFSNKTWQRPPRFDSWEGALWEVRQQCGASFTDSALFYMFKTLGDFPDLKLEKQGTNWSVSSQEFNTYFYGGFLRGEWIVDNERHNQSKIMSILIKRGLVPK